VNAGTLCRLRIDVARRRLAVARSSRLRRRESDLAIALSALRLAACLRGLGRSRRALAAANRNG
jgi:hypothetical protein